MNRNSGWLLVLAVVLLSSCSESQTNVPDVPCCRDPYRDIRDGQVGANQDPSSSELQPSEYWKEVDENLYHQQYEVDNNGELSTFEVDMIIAPYFEEIRIYRVEYEDVANISSDEQTGEQLLDDNTSRVTLRTVGEYIEYKGNSYLRSEGETLNADEEILLQELLADEVISSISEDKKAVLAHALEYGAANLTDGKVFKGALKVFSIAIKYIVAGITCSFNPKSIKCEPGRHPLPERNGF